jgi:hypothetical protein
MHVDERLPSDRVWQADGHLTEIALTALADGQDAILPEDAAAHVVACGPCAAALGHAALLSLQAGEALREADAGAAEAARADAGRAAQEKAGAEAPRVSAPAPAWPLPVAAVMAALTAAALGAAPRLGARAAQLPDAIQELGRALLVAMRAGRAIAESGALTSRGWLVALPWMAAALLLMLGLGVARAAPGRMSLKEGGAS